MFNDHQMSLVHDLAIIGPQINNIDFIAIAAITTSDYPKLSNIYNASILIPPTEMLMRWADGDQFVIQNEYPRYLLSQVPNEMIISLLALLTKKNVILYIPMDEFNVFGKYLLDYIYFTYGIVCNTQNTQFSADQSKLPFIMAQFYMIDVMSANDFIEAYPASYSLPPFIINKLAEDLRPFPGPATFEQYSDYFNNLNRSKGISIADPSMVKVVDKK